MRPTPNSGRCSNEMEGRRLGGCTRVYTGHSRKQAPNGFAKLDASQCCGMWDVGCGMLHGTGGPRGEEFCFSGACGILVRILTPPPTPETCHGQIMTSGAKHFGRGRGMWAGSSLPSMVSFLLRGHSLLRHPLWESETSGLLCYQLSPS